MIAIFSFENDPTTDRVINWLIHLKANFIRINSEDIFNISYFDFNEGILVLGKEERIDLNKIKIAWYRRWGSYKQIKNTHSKYNLNERQVSEEIRREADEISKYIFWFLSKTKWLSNPFRIKDYNKLKALKLAKQVGLSVPESLLIGDRYYFKNSTSGYITKSIGDGDVYYLNKDTMLKSFAHEIDSNLASIVNETFFPSLLQKKINRVLELRVFYLNGGFYATAMIVKENNKIDIKLATSANQSLVNFIPYKLSTEIKIKLNKFMKHLGLNLGAFDLILDSDETIHFIEMNPIGQFIGYSFPCNYMLEKLVAEYLINN